MNPEHKAIITEEQYEAVASRIEELANAAADSEDAKELKRLIGLIVEFECRRQKRSPAKPKLNRI